VHQLDAEFSVVLFLEAWFVFLLLKRRYQT